MAEQQDKRISERQNTIRRFMLEDRLHNPNFDILLCCGDIGDLTERRWFLFGQVAIYNQGSLLTDEDVWPDIVSEMKIPSILWADGMRRSTRGRGEAQQVLRASSYTFPSTMWGNNIRVRPVSWWQNKIRNVSYIDVIAWLGLIGGELPS